ncbi:MAG: hypothetical protein HFP77_00310 [Methylococcales symbiont of Iophon sp. n. MRB-2018]|nr:MAG: hypothetical protein HFP77_00310 [Methylococcales symbiont of Iophon sp. n. MRB-2018]KAF3980580.1 MAG: hypothetical protein HFP76_01355 [Methylococcales symbiont of Iophon sp. n. MRB-2018]
MRVFDDEEKSIISKIIDGAGYARNLINIIDSMNNLQGVRIGLNRQKQTGEFLFETVNNEPTDNEMSSSIQREKSLVELLITHVTLLRYLEKEELAFFFDPAGTSESEITFGMGATNRPYLTMAINDKSIVDLLLIYVHKEIRPSPLLRQLRNNNYLTDEEIKFNKQYYATWFTIIVSVVLGLYGIYNNQQNSKAQEKQFQTQLMENEKLSNIIASSINNNKTKPIDYKSDIKQVTDALSEISKEASSAVKNHTVEVKLIPQEKAVKK